VWFWSFLFNRDPFLLGWPIWLGWLRRLGLAVSGGGGFRFFQVDDLAGNPHYLLLCHPVDGRAAAVQHLGDLDYFTREIL
jgi:hypothetical protein